LPLPKLLKGADYIILRTIQKYRDAGLSPSYIDLVRETGYYPTTIRRALKRLEEDGYISIAHARGRKSTYETLQTIE